MRSSVPSDENTLRASLRSMFDASPLAIQFFGPDGGFRDANAAWCANWGATLAGWQGYNILTDPQLAEAGLLPFLEKGFAGETVELSAFYYDPARSGRDGRDRWVHMCLHPVLDQENHIDEVMVIQHDVSEYKQIEDVLRFLSGVSSSLTFSLDYQTVLARLTELAVPYIADWCFVDVLEEGGTFHRTSVAHARENQVALARDLERRYDLLPDDPSGTSLIVASGAAEIVPDINSARMTAATPFLQVLRQLGVQSYICVPIKIHGRLLGAMTFGSAESNRRYGPADLALAEELAHRAAMAVDNARLYREAQDANRAKDEFLMVAAHELRTPLTTLVGYAHMLLTNRMTETTMQDALGRVEQDAWSLVQIVNDIVDVSRVIAGRIQLDPRPIDLSTVIEAAALAVRPTADAKGVRLRVNREHQTGIVAGDANRIQQILWHLLANAIKFTPAGGEVELRTDSSTTHAIITITDTGIGISPEFLPYVFERFRQHDSTMTRTHSGLGLGLSIVKYLAELHGGRVHAYSRGEGHGSAFTLELPLIASLAWQSSERRKFGEADRDPTLLENMRILAVDHDADVRDSLAAGLREFGAEVRTSATATEAMSMLGDWDPDVLVSDMSMPGIDGYALIRKVRASHDPSNQIPAVALTTHMRTSDRLRTLSAGYQAHLAKPVKPAELAFAIASLTGRGAKSQETTQG